MQPRSKPAGGGRQSGDQIDDLGTGFVRQAGFDPRRGFRDDVHADPLNRKISAKITDKGDTVTKSADPGSNPDSTVNHL
jgi:hypothetical protein